MSEVIDPWKMSDLVSPYRISDLVDPWRIQGFVDLASGEAARWAIWGGESGKAAKPRGVRVGRILDSHGLCGRGLAGEGSAGSRIHAMAIAGIAEAVTDAGIAVCV